ncbi:hypothetical protein [Actinomadura sp. 9N407]|uniref:hypothetical protein n=1 Tax=Actinomadura sp. 9N407 TaxID=3375154 RepID=UPI003797B35F
MGIDPIRIATADGDFYTLRCYLRDAPVFLGSQGRIEVFRTERGLAAWIANWGATGHDLEAASTWPKVMRPARAGELEIEVDDINAYTLAGIEEYFLSGDLVALTPNSWATGRRDPYWPAQACELLLDAGAWAGDDSARQALDPAQPLGRLMSPLLDPSAELPAPAPRPAEAALLRGLVDKLTSRFSVHEEPRR